MRAKPIASPELKEWLNRLDSYTNAEFGHAFTICVPNKVCVACGQTVTAADARGLCATCDAKRRPDHTEIVLFRALRRRPAK